MNNIKPLIAASMIALISACSSTSETIAQQEQRNQVLNNRFSEAESLVNALKTRLAQAGSDELGYFAPDKLADAKELYKDAKDDFDDILADKTDATKSKTNSIKSDVQKANMALDAAYATKKTAETILADSFDIRDQLVKLNAAAVLPKTYKQLMGDIDDIVEEVADGDLEDAREENAELLPKLRAFEIRTVKLIELKSVREQMAYLKKAKASRNAPVTYKKALSTVQGAESTIATDPRDQAKIKASVAEAEFAIEHTKQMMQSVTELASIKRSQRENYLIQFENLLLTLSKDLGDKDFRNVSFSEQGKQILQLIAENKAASAQLKQQIATLQSGIAAGDKKGAELLAQAQQTQTDLQSQITEKEKLMAAQNDSMNALQLRLDEANKRVLELQRVEVEKDKQLLTLEKSNLALNSEVSKLQAQVQSLAKPDEALKAMTPPVAAEAVKAAAEEAQEKAEDATKKAEEKIEQATEDATQDDEPKATEETIE